MNLNNFYISLQVMGQGMFGIFFFMSVFYGLIVVLGKMFPPDEKTEA